jgi:hypothetical protein
MARLPIRRTIEWSVVLELAVLARDHLGRLTPGERAHLAALVRKSRGRPGNLTPQERSDIRRLTEKLDLLVLGRSAAPIVRRLRPIRR